MDQYINNFIYLLFSILLVYIVFEMSNNVVNYKVTNNCNCKESFQNNVVYPQDALIDTNNLNSPEYSHTVNLPINDPVSCSNFCGPTGKCLKTGTQCLADIDCAGCQPRTNPYPNTVYNENALMSEASGKLSGALGLNYSPLITSYSKNFDEAYPGSYNTEVGQLYLGPDKWKKTFNEGILLYNKRQESNPYLTDFEKSIQPAYPVQLSATGLFYETTPLPGNVPTNM
jgi:hypothetical protein